MPLPWAIQVFPDYRRLHQSNHVAIPQLLPRQSEHQCIELLPAHGDRAFPLRSDRRARQDTCHHHFTPDPQRGFNRGATDYFVNGRQIDIGAFDTPKHAGMPLGEVARVGKDHFDINASDKHAVLNNGDALTWWDLQGELQGVPVNAARQLGGSAR